MLNGISETSNDILQSFNLQKTPQDNRKTQSEETKLEDCYVPSESQDLSKLCGYIYYHGERMMQGDFVQKAIDDGVIEMDETKSAFQAYDEAWEKLIEAKAKPLFKWSKALYSEDGKYKFRVENGEITGMILAQDSNGNSFIDMAKQLASGVRPCEIKGSYSSLVTGDFELYSAACDIGSSKRIYESATQEYQSGTLSFKQYLDEIEPLFFILFRNSNITTSKLTELHAFYTQDKDIFAQKSLENYDSQKWQKAFDPKRRKY